MTYLYPHERELTCTKCAAVVIVFEAASGARSVEEHRHIQPNKFRCDGCSTAKDFGGSAAACESVKA